MVEDQVVSLVTNLTATGITATTAVSAMRARDILRRRRYSEELESVATEFMQALETAIEAENNRRETKELAGIVDDWSAIAQQVATTGGDNQDTPSDEVHRERDQLALLLEDEETAVRQLARTIAGTQGYDLDQAPELREALEAALTRAYREAMGHFEERIAGTDLADVLLTETNLELTDRVTDLQHRLAELGADIESLLTQPARDEGFRHLTPSGFALGPDPRPKRCWRIGFTLADVRAGLPAERSGQDSDQVASVELYAGLRQGEDRIVVGGPGSGKSTLCKQVAIRWYKNDETGPVIYRESGAGGGSQFESVEALRQAITATDAHTLVVVEDAVQPDGNAIFEVIELLAGYEQVSFLLDDLQTAVDEFEGSGPVESSIRPRQAELAASLRRYHLPRLTTDDIQRVIAAFEDATGRTVDRSPRTFREELSVRSDSGIGEMLLLSFLLPVSDEEGLTTGLERNVRNRYETLSPDYGTAMRDLSRFEPDLCADVGVMVTLLNASGIGIKPELVHALGNVYGHDWETHDEIADIRAALEGWFLYKTQSESADGVVRTTHRLWSTLYLRELAFDHEDRQQSGRRRERSDRRFGRCLSALFSLFDNPEHRERLRREFPESPLLEEFETAPAETASEYLVTIFETGVKWPALAPLVGTSRTARYELPETCSDTSRLRAIEMRGHAHRLRGNHTKARTEYQRVLETAVEAGAEHAEARSYNHLGLVAESAGEIASARDRFQEGLAHFRELGDISGQAMCLSNLGLVARKQGNLRTAREYHERSLALFEDSASQHIEAACLGNLGIVAQTRGDLSAAQTYLRRSLELARSLGDRHAKAEALIGLGLVTRYEGNFATAVEYIERSLKIERELGNRHGQAMAQGVRGLIARDRGDYDTARECYETGLDLCREIADKHGEATLLGGLAMLDCAEENYHAAREHIDRSLNLFRELGDEHAIAETVGLSGAIDVARGELTAGREKLSRARSLLADVDAPLTELQILRYHMETERDRGNHDRVRTLYQAATDCLEQADSDLGYEQDRIETCHHAVTK